MRLRGAVSEYNSDAIDKGEFFTCGSRETMSEYNSDAIDKGVFFICGSGRQHGEHILCIYSAYIEHILEQAGKKEELGELIIDIARRGDRPATGRNRQKQAKTD